MSIIIEKICEERDNKPFSDWVTEPEDDRIFTGPIFGLPGESWGTVVTIYLADDSRRLPKFTEFFGRPRASWPVSEVLQIRVCSPDFEEKDIRFCAPHTSRKLIQKAFDFEDVVRYCRQKLEDSQGLQKKSLISAWGSSFFIIDSE